MKTSLISNGNEVRDLAGAAVGVAYILSKETLNIH